MSNNISYNIDRIQVLLENIEVNLRETKLEYVDFGLEGSSSGLNSFKYSYVRLANFLVEYRRFVRNDIVEVCNAINGFIELDATAAVCINDNSISSFQDFTVNVDNTTDAAGTQTLPSISTSSFKVSRLDTENMTAIYTASILPLSARLKDMKDLVNLFTVSSDLSGDTATAIKNYWTEVHIPIIEAIDFALWTLYDYMMAYGPDLYAVVNDDLYFVLPQSEMEAAVSEMTSIRASLENIVNDVDSKITSYSTLLGVNVAIPNGIPMLDKYQQEATEIQTLMDSIISFESSKVTLVKDYIDDFVTNMTQLITAIESEVVVENYETGKFIDICNSNNITVFDDVSAYERTMEQYIDAFEAANPEYAAVMNDFLNDDADCSTSLTDDMKNEIKYTAYTAPEPYRTIIFNAIMNGDISLGSLSVDNFGLTAFNNPVNNTVNLTTSVTNSIDIATFWHEFGHAADDLGGFGWASVTSYRTYNSTMGKEVSFAEAMYYDIYDNPNNPHSIFSLANSCINDGYTGNVDRVVDAFKTNGYTTLAPEDAALYREIAKRFLQGQSDFVQSTDYSNAEAEKIFGSVADTYGGMTHNGLVNEYDSNTGAPLYRATWGHDTWYWGYPASSAPTEFYAAYFSANVTGNEAELALMKEYYPTATSVADSYSNQLAGK